MRIVLHANCTTALVEGKVTPSMLDAMEKALTYTEPGARFTPQYKYGHWDGKKCLYNKKLHSFPAGLYPRIESLAARESWPLDLVDERPDVDLLPDEIPALADGTVLFDDQKLAVARFLDNPRGCLALPTAAGKTEIAGIVAMLARPRRVLVIADRTSLTSQTQERFERRLGERIGLAGGGYRDSSRRVTVATVQWLRTHFARLQSFFDAQYVVIVDEAHGISDMYTKILSAVHAPVRLGLSATIKEAPRRMVVESYLGPIIHEQEPSELIESGRLAEPTIYMIRVGGLVADGDDPYMRGVVRNGVRNAVIRDAVARCAQESKPVLVLVVRIEHGITLANLTGLPFVSGETHPDLIRSRIRDLESGAIPGLIASTIFDKGIDIPAIRVLIHAGAYRSPLLTIQRAGRAMRRKLTGENRVTILDLFDLSHGMLESQALARERTYRKKKYETHVVGSLSDIGSL